MQDQAGELRSYPELWCCVSEVRAANLRQAAMSGLVGTLPASKDAGCLPSLGVSGAISGFVARVGLPSGGGWIDIRARPCGPTLATPPSHSNIR